MAKREMKKRVIEILDNYPVTRDTENPDTMVFCLILMEDGLIDKYKAKEIYDRYSINNVVKARQKIQNKDNMFEPCEETKEKRRVAFMDMRHKWRKGKFKV
ncbi:MAG: hypothetical protein HXM48_04185 [Leptotrichia sp.]|nr:hypothetical protein [Leptotrichia sp.]